jgi:hypothetical protein
MFTTLVPLFPSETKRWTSIVLLIQILSILLPDDCFWFISYGSDKLLAFRKTFLYFTSFYQLRLTFALLFLWSENYKLSGVGPYLTSS